MSLSPFLRSQERLAQNQTFAPRLQHAVRLLHMSAPDYAGALAEEASVNPFLVMEPGSSPIDEAAASPAAEVLAASWTDLPRQRRATQEELDGASRLSRPPSLREHLHGQLGVLRLSQEERLCASAIVESLDEDGYLRVSLEELAQLDTPTGCGIDERDAGADRGEESASRWRTALLRVQSLDPCGVGARDLCECLGLQLSGISDAGCRALAARILREHLALLGSGDMRRLKRLTGSDDARLAAAVGAIRRMRPRPGADFARDEAPAVKPEVAVLRRGGRWIAVLNEDAFPRLRLDGALTAWARRERQPAHAEARLLLDRAQWLVQNLGQRAATIHSVATEIVRRQALFFDHGPLALKPLEMRDVAAQVGVHPSTVSRVAHNKFMATPMGTFELHHFFARPAPSGSAAACAPAALQALLRTLVAAEPPGQPHSDVQLARLLAQQGFALARRTVTKYRQALRIESVEKRRLAATR